MSFVSDIEITLQKLNDEIIDENEWKNRRIELKKRFHDIIQFHGDSKQLSRFSENIFRFNKIYFDRLVTEFSAVYNDMIAMCLIVISLLLTATLLQLDMVKSLFFPRK